MEHLLYIECYGITYPKRLTDVFHDGSITDTVSLKTGKNNFSTITVVIEGP